jgi:hypothetical protein
MAQRLYVGIMTDNLGRSPYAAILATFVLPSG